MIKILMHGCNGKMGRMITEIAKQDQDVEIVAGVDKYTAVANEYPVFETISECDVDADAVIDFSKTNSDFPSGIADRLAGISDQIKNSLTHFYAVQKNLWGNIFYMYFQSDSQIIQHCFFAG